MSTPAFTDQYTWRVEYTDGTQLSEIAADGTILPFGAVAMGRVRALSVVPYEGWVGSLWFLVWLMPGQRPIFFRRRSIELDPNTGEQTVLPATTCIGWQETRRGRNVASYLFILPDGETILTSDPTAV